jgi:dihydrofolate reductase
MAASHLVWSNVSNLDLVTGPSGPYRRPSLAATSQEEGDMTSARPFISAMQVTLDGYLMGPKEETDWVDSWADGLGLLPPVDAFVLGGGMFPQYEQFWAAILDEGDAAADLLGRKPYTRELSYARHAAETPHYVLSTTLTDHRWPSAQIVRDLGELRALRQQRGQAVYVVGGPGLLASLIGAGLLDEIRLIVHPVVVGGGLALFGGITEREDIELVTAAPRSAGRVNLTYRLTADDAGD